MANLIGKPLSDGCLRYQSTHQPSAWTAPSEGAKHVVCITGKDGSIVHPRKQGKEDAKIRVRQQSCFICRQYMLRTVNTQWKCCKCGMPLFQVDRSDGIAQRPYSCIYEHLSSQDEYIGCKLMKRNCFILPDHLRKFSMTRQQKQMHEQDKKRKRNEWQGQNVSQQSLHTPAEEWCRASIREREKKRMDEAREACSQTVQRALGKRTRSEGRTPNRVFRGRK